MPCVLKCVLRSAGLLKWRPHTLQVCLPSPSSTCDHPVLDGDPGDPARSEVTFPDADLPPRDTSVSSAGASRTRWLMKRCLLREEADAKHAPHCWHWKALPPSPRWQAMCCRNSSLSSVAKPHGMQRNPAASWSSGAGSLHSANRLSASSETPPRELGPPSCSDELSAGSAMWGLAWKRDRRLLCPSAGSMKGHGTFTFQSSDRLTSCLLRCLHHVSFWKQHRCVLYRWWKE